MDISISITKHLFPAIGTHRDALYRLSSHHYAREDFLGALEHLENVLSIRDDDSIPDARIYFDMTRCSLALFDSRSKEFIAKAKDAGCSQNELAWLQADELLMKGEVDEAITIYNTLKGNGETSRLIFLLNWRDKIRRGEPLPAPLPDRSEIDPLYRSVFDLLDAYYALFAGEPERTANFLKEHGNGVLERELSLLTVQSALVNNSPVEADSLVSKLSVKDEYTEFLALQSTVESCKSLNTALENSRNFIEVYGAKAVEEFTKSVTLNQRHNQAGASLFLSFLEFVLNKLQGTARIDAVIATGLEVKGLSYPEKFAYHLKGLILEQQHQNSEAVESFFEAGKRHYWSDEFELAQRLFKMCIQINPFFADAHWYLADTLYVLSFNQAPPKYLDEDRLNEAGRVWDEAFKSLHPSHDYSWTYITKARIETRHVVAERQLNMDPARKGLLYFEAALLFDPTNYFRLAPTAAVFNDLAMENNALALAIKAVTNKEDDVGSWSEMTRSYINTGNFEEGRRGIKKLKELDPTSVQVYDGWEAYMKYMEGKFGDAKTLLENLSTPDLWQLNLLMIIYWIEGNSTSADNYADKVLAFEAKEEYTQKETELALGAFVKGDWKKCRELIEPISARHDFQPQSLIIILLLDLFEVKIDDAQRHFTELINQALRIPEIADAIQLLNGAVKNLNTQSDADRLKSIAAAHEFIYRLKDLSPKAVNPDDFTLLTAEIQDTLDNDENYRPGSVGRITLHSSLARIHLEQKKYGEAFLLFNELAGQSRNTYPLMWSDLAAIFFRQLNSVEEYWKCNDEVTDAAKRDTGTNSMIAAIRLKQSSEGRLAELLQITNTIGNAEQLLPVILEMDAALIPEKILSGEAKDVEWILIKEFIPATRNAILSDYGVEVPGIRIRMNVMTHMRDGGYIISFKEIPIVFGKVKHEFLYCFNVDESFMNKLAIPAEDCLKEQLPFEAQPGWWIHRRHESVLKQNEVRCYDPLEMIMRHVQFMLVKNMPLFFGAQQVENTLKKWQEDKDLQTILNSIINEADALQIKIRLGKVLRELLADKVPITDTKAIVTGIAESGLKHDDVFDDVLIVRRYIRNYIISASSDFVVIRLPDQLEESLTGWVLTIQGKKTVAAKPEIVQEWLNEFRHFFKEQLQNNFVGATGALNRVVLLVNDPENRVVVSRVMRLEFPDVIILNTSEWEGMRNLQTDEYVTTPFVPA